tara:strand:- start:25 stop:675 length:651 start_codon:yes stop_codon:yes gene_type:complete
MSEEYTKEQITQMKMKAALEASEALPSDTFAAVPDEDIVTLEVSGQFGRVLNRVLEYLYQCEDEATVIKSANLVANNFEGLKQEEINLHALSLWAISNLLANFSMEAGVQNKTKIYDKEKIMTHIFGGVTSDEPLNPLTPEELEERKVSKPVIKGPREDAIVNLDEVDAEKARDARRQHRNKQRETRSMERLGPRSYLSDEDLAAREEKEETNPED